MEMNSPCLALYFSLYLQYVCLSQSAEELPPLLHSWRGHERAIVSSEVLVYESQLFVLSASVDGARLWTREGGCVGCFGQERQWALSDPDTHQTNRYNGTSVIGLNNGQQVQFQKKAQCTFSDQSA